VGGEGKGEGGGWGGGRAGTSVCTGTCSDAGAAVGRGADLQAGVTGAREGGGVALIPMKQERPSWWPSEGRREGGGGRMRGCGGRSGAAVLAAARQSSSSANCWSEGPAACLSACCIFARPLPRPPGSSLSLKTNAHPPPPPPPRRRSAFQKRTPIKYRNSVQMIAARVPLPPPPPISIGFQTAPRNGIRRRVCCAHLPTAA